MRSKNSYEIRAMRFIKEISEYITDWDSNVAIRRGLLEYNTMKSRKVQYNHGATRHCLITSDYCVKWDKPRSSASNLFGGCKEELEFYYNTACREGYSHLFTKPTACFVDGRLFLIMPRVRVAENLNVEEHVTPEELDFLKDNIFDVIDHNYGYLHGCFVFYDYAAHY